MSFSDSSDEHDVVNNWLRILGARVQINLQLDHDGMCAIGHLSGIDCALEVPEGCGKIFLRAPILSLDLCNEATLRFCLAQHLLGINTAGAVFAIDQKDNAMVLWQTRDLAGLDLESFAMMVVEFFEAADHWRYELDSLQRPPEEKPAGANPVQRINEFALRA